MPRTKPENPAPDWFNFYDYAVAKKFDLVGWYLALMARSEALDNLITGHLTPYDFKPKGKEQLLFDLYWKYASPKSCFVGQRLYHKAPETFLIGEQPLEEISLEYLTTEKHRYLLGDKNSRALIMIDLDAPDGVLIDTFSQLLAGKRKTNPSLVKRPGRKPKIPNTKITKHHFATWLNYNVLACFDLDYWWKLQEKEELRLSHSALCESAAPIRVEDPENQKEWGIAARENVTLALSLVDSIAHQIKGGKQ